MYQIITQFQQLKKMHEHMNASEWRFQMLMMVKQMTASGSILAGGHWPKDILLFFHLVGGEVKEERNKGSQGFRRRPGSPIFLAGAPPAATLPV